MTDRESRTTESGLGSLLDELPVDHLKQGAADLLTALAERAVGSLADKLTNLNSTKNDGDGDLGPGVRAVVSGGKALAEGASPVTAAMTAGLGGARGVVSQAFGRGRQGSSGGKSAKVVNIIEEFDVGLPLRVAYDQWTRFQDFPTFTRKVNSVDQPSDEKVNWTAQIFLSHRSWASTIVEQVPDDRIVWRSTGAKGHVDGAVTFHRLAPTLTRILMVLEYHPKGLFEKTGNIWRAQGRRARSDFRHIKRHMMTRTILDQEGIEGWRGEIRNGEVVRSHEEAVEDERRRLEDESAGDETRFANEDSAEDLADADDGDLDDDIDDDIDEDWAVEDDYDDGENDDDGTEDEYVDDEFDLDAGYDAEDDYDDGTEYEDEDGVGVNDEYDDEYDDREAHRRRPRRLAGTR